MNRYRLSRRQLLAAASAGFTALVAACRGPAAPEVTPSPAITPNSTSLVPEATPARPTPSSPASTPPLTPVAAATPTPAPVRLAVWSDPALSPRLAEAAARALDRLRALPASANVEVASSTRADAALRFVGRVAPPTGASVIASEPLVPVVSPRLPVRNVTGDQLAGLLSGKITDWKDAGSPSSLAVQPTIVGGIDSLGTSSSAQPVDSYEALVAGFAARPGTIALVSAGQVDVRAGSLRVDGIDLLTSSIDANAPVPPLDLVLEGTRAAYEEIANAFPGGIAALRDDGPVETGATVTVVGDVILGRTVHTIMTRLHDYAAPFRRVADELRAADLTIADLECSLSDSITPPTDPYTFSFMTYTAAAEGLALAGIDGISGANNHSMNFGMQGMNDTLAALDAKGIKHFGIGKDLAAARRPGIFDMNGLRIGFLGYDGITGDSYGATEQSAGTSPLVVQNLVNDIAALKPKVDVVVPFIHWGIEYTLTPTDEQRAIAHRAIDAGATLVIGSHPHWVQGIELYKGKPIIYSLGNFVFDQDWSLETKQGLILHLVFRGARLAAMRFVPVLIEDFYRPRIVDGAQMTEILDRVWQSSDLIAAET